MMTFVVRFIIRYLQFRVTQTKSTLFPFHSRWLKVMAEKYEFGRRFYLLWKKRPNIFISSSAIFIISFLLIINSRNLVTAEGNVGKYVLCIASSQNDVVSPNDVFVSYRFFLFSTFHSLENVVLAWVVVVLRWKIVLVRVGGWRWIWIVEPRENVSFSSSTFVSAMLKDENRKTAWALIHFTHNQNHVLQFHSLRFEIRFDYMFMVWFSYGCDFEIWLVL